MKRLLFLLFHLYLQFSHAQSLIILKNEDSGELGNYVSYFKDSGGIHSIHQIIVNDKDFTKNYSRVFVPPVTPFAFWVKLQVKNVSNNNYYMVINNPAIDTLDIYSIHHNNTSHLINTGDSKPFNQRNIQRSNYIIPVSLPKNDTLTFYIRYYSLIRNELPITFKTAPIIFKKSIQWDLWYGFFYGIFFIIIFFSLTLYLKSRDKNYLYYLGYIFFVGLYRMYVFGHVFQYIIPNHPKLANDLPYFLISVAGCFIVAFGFSFLKVKEKAPTIAKWSYLFYTLFIIGYLISFIDKLISFEITTFALLTTSLFLFSLGIYIYRQSYSPAFYYTLAFGSFSICLFIAFAAGYRLLPYNTISNEILNIGITIEAIMLSLAIGNRYHLIKEEKEKAQLALAKELEKKIKERNQTQKELTDLNESLINSNLDLDNFIYTASHELKSPITNIEGLINIINSEKYDPNQLKKMMNMMTTSIEKFKGTIEDLTELSKVHKISEKNIINNDVQAVVEEILDELAEKISNTKAIVKCELTNYPTIKFSELNFRRILFNLISNALKFRSPSRIPEIKIKTDKIDSYLVLSISDNGLGISKINLKNLFSIFKRAHSITSGKGIGLYIVKRIINNAQGKIEVKSEEGKGTTFMVYFKN